MEKTKKICAYGLLFLLTTTSCFKEQQAEELKESFIRFFGGAQAGEAREVIQLADGNYLLLGHSANSDSFGYNVNLIKIDPYGNTLWNKNIGGFATEKAYSFQLLPDNSIVIAANTTEPISGTGKNSIMFIKTDGNGNTIWVRNITNENSILANHLVTKNDGGFLITGSIAQAATDNDLLFLTTNSEGKNEKFRTVAANGNQQANFAAISDNGFVFIGTNSGGNDVKGTSDILIASGNETRWHSQENTGGNGADYGKAIKALSDGSFACLATINSADSGNNFLLFKIIKDVNGYTTLWQKQFGTKYDDDATALVITENGFALAGNTTNIDGSTDILFIETNLEGKELFRKSIGGLGNQRAYGLCSTSDGGYAIAAGNEYSGNSMIMLIKMKKPE